MKKTALTLAATALLVAACGGSGDDEAAAETTDAPTTTTVAPTTTTVAPTTTTAAEMVEVESFVPSGDPELDAVATAFMVAFDSTTDYAAKLPYVDDLSGLEDTVVRYMEQGEAMGGVSVVIRDVVIDGDSADVFYDLMFNNRPTYPDLSSTAVLTTDGWKVPRNKFCGMMASARVPCPSG